MNKFFLTNHFGSLIGIGRKETTESGMLKLKELESYLSGLERFREPKFELEQYNTSAHLASRMIYMAETQFADISQRKVADFGTGSGVLAIAAQMMGSSYTVGFDLDADALEIAKENIADFEVDVDLIQCNLANQLPVQENCFDTVVMNPPFGTRVKGIDMVFLQRALQISSHAVYSIHKTTTRKHILKKAAEWGVKVEVLAEMKFDIPQMYKFHKKKSVDVYVDLIRFTKQ